VPDDAAVWESQKYEHEIWEVEQGFLWTPNHIKTRLEVAGVVEVETKRYRIDGYGEGAEDAVSVWSGVVEPLVADMGRYYPDPVERAILMVKLSFGIRGE
jgi:hypothetical protein